MKRHQSFIILLLAGITAAQSYVWPTNASRTVTGVFGEARPRRFHAGLDIRTWGKTGYELYAVSDGYIQRIRTGSQGYGKAIYLKLDDGHIAVYAHMKSFTPDINQTARALQETAQSYTIDHYFLPNEFPVKRGQIIGYSGDTGTISGPHLHFEIRDKNENPVNPQLLGFRVKDTIPPEFYQLSVIPFAADSRVGHSPVPSLHPAVHSGENRYIIPDTLIIRGPAGLAVNIKDRINDQPFHYGPFSIELAINNTLWFKRLCDTYSFREEPLSIWDTDYALSQLTGERFYCLFHDPSINVQSFVKRWNPDGLPASAGIYPYKITVSDYAGNTVALSGVIKIVNRNAPDDTAEYGAIFQSHLPPTENGISIYQFRNGLLFGLSKIDTHKEPALIVTTSSGDQIVPLIEQPDGGYFSPLVDPEQLENMTGITLNSGAAVTTNRVTGKFVPPSNPFSLETPDGRVILSGDADCFYFPTLVWTYPMSNTRELSGGKFLYGPIIIGPELIPFKQEIAFEVLKHPDDPENAGIFVLDRKKSKWIYMNTVDNGNYLSTTLLSGGVFAVITESAPPVIENLIPSSMAVLDSKNFNELSFNIRDVFSGIDGERNVSIFLDEKSLIFEYNSYEKSVSYLFWDSLPAGEHRLEIRAADNIGNLIETTQIFTIR